MILNAILNVAMALVGLGALLYVVGTYNTLVRFDKEVDRAFSNIDVILMQRHDELPALVSACKGYMKHERELLERLSTIREAYQKTPGPTGKVAMENQLLGLMGQFWARVEAYPDLKADEQFLRLHARITSLENTIADRRELYNDGVAGYNTYIQQFPPLLLARPLGYRERPMLKAPPESKAAPPTQFT